MTTRNVEIDICWFNGGMDGKITLSIANDLLECSVCLERLDTSSKALPCQHTFCRRCLEDIVSSKDELRCPECRILVKMKVDELPPNVLLMRILGGLRDTTKIEVPPKTQHSPTVQVPVTDGKPAKTPDNKPTQQPMPNRPVLGAGTNPSPHKVLPQNVCHAKALFDFESNITGDLAFKKGDVIVLRRRIDQNWFYGHLNGREGAFPVNHVQIIVPLPVPQARAVFDFRMGPNEEEGCLSFSKGQIINVLRRIDQNWAEGRIGECVGIFPINFVELNPLAKQLMSGQTEKGTRRSSLGENVTGQMATLPPMPVNPPTTAKPGRSYPIPNQVNPGHRQSTDNCAATELPRLLPHVAVFAYKPQKHDELELIKGAHYFVSDRCQDGWLRGMNSARKAGVFPGNHVVPLKDFCNAAGSADQISTNTVRTPVTTPTSPPVLPPRNQTIPFDPLPETPLSQNDKKDSINLIKRFTNNISRSKSPEDRGSASSTSVTVAPGATTGQPRQVHSSAHFRSGSCPSQLLDLSGLKVNQSGSQRLRGRGQKERPVLHSLHRHLGERKEDLTVLTPSHKKSNSLDAGRLISSGQPLAEQPTVKVASSSRGSAGAQLKENRYRCIVPYPPNSEYELELSVGDIVFVNKKRENGWYRGVHQKSGKSGLFPASFVEPLVEINGSE